MASAGFNDCSVGLHFTFLTQWFVMQILANLKVPAQRSLIARAASGKVTKLEQFIS